MKSSLYICRKSAFEYWHVHRAVGTARPDQLELVPHVLYPLGVRLSRIGSLQEYAPTDERLREALAHELQDISLPVELLIPHKSLRRDSACKHCFTWREPVASGAFFTLGNDVYVSSPEFMIVQLAKILSEADLIKLAYELCGSYALAFRGRPGHARCLPLTTVGNIHHFAEKCSGAAGVSKLLSALRSVTDKAASPAEAIMIALLCTRRSRGGYGAPLPLMNYVIDLPSAIRGLARQNRIICDAYWPAAHLALEYDGRPAHTGDANITKDYARENTLHAIGVQTITISHYELCDLQRFDYVAQRVLKALKVRARGKHGYDHEWEIKRDRLYTELMQSPEVWRRCTCGLRS